MSSLMKLENLGRKIIFGSLITLGVISTVSAGLAGLIITPLVNAICSLYGIVLDVAGVIAVVVIAMQGVKWVASENDPGARKQAKETIINALIGLIIVIVANEIVRMVLGYTVCP